MHAQQSESHNTTPLTMESCGADEHVLEASFRKHVPCTTPARFVFWAASRKT
jgi:hypothetical protein